MFSKGKFIPHNAKPKAKAPLEKTAMPAKPMQGEGGDHADEQQEHSSQTHGTSPHPVTGVHAVHIHNHGGHAMTHTHHEGGHVESMKHNTLADAHTHAQEQLPSGADETQDADNNQQDNGMGSDTAMAGLGSMGDAA